MNPRSRRYRVGNYTKSDTIDLCLENTSLALVSPANYPHASLLHSRTAHIHSYAHTYARPLSLHFSHSPSHFIPHTLYGLIR